MNHGSSLVSSPTTLSIVPTYLLGNTQSLRDYNPFAEDDNDNNPLLVRMTRNPFTEEETDSFSNQEDVGVPTSDYNTGTLFALLSERIFSKSVFILV
ncbi:hypothetical protein EB796_002817 [Bugula neritina]|uniref:Uncharacterized protein n=1 Tax=Bugula neritina TaxID=10212 RepID=A0A7J7KL83_BUGNE|nr:hypothetical protein EB796_002817 [Bugula neritina]